MKRISLSRGKFALVDNINYEYLNQWKWYYNNGYAARDQRNLITKKDTRIYMHRIIMKAKKSENIDHVNHNGIDNQKRNLRKSTHEQNMHNMKSNKNSTSQYKGVCWAKNNKKWKVQINYNNKHIYLGYYTNEKVAAKVYDKAAIKLHKEFAYLNFPQRKN